MLARIGLFIALPVAMVAGPILAMDTAIVSVRDGDSGTRIIAPVPLTLIKVASVFAPDDCQMEYVPELAEYHDSLMKIIKEFSKMEDGDLVSVRDHGTLVDVRKDRGNLIVQVTDGETKVHAKLPLKLAERVIASSGDGRISPAEAMAAMDGTLSGKIVDVQEGDTHVKVWVW